MKEQIKVGIVQMRSEADPWLNLALVDNFVTEAVRLKCDLVCFPENVFYRGPKNSPNFSRNELFLSLTPDSTFHKQNEFSIAISEQASNWPIWVSLGSVLEKNSEEKSSETRPFNSHFLLEPNGRKIYSYRKRHLFDFLGNDAAYQESRDICPGKKIISVAFENFNLGLSICYDLRFPELYRELSLNLKSNVLLVPAAFTAETGAAHWHCLLRARAIENQSYVIAAAQWGQHQSSNGKTLSCYGHTIAYDPWGELLAEAPMQNDALLTVNISTAQLTQVRSKLPALQSANFFHEISDNS